MRNNYNIHMKSIFIVLYIIKIIICKNKIFIPNNEWQEIPDGLSVPAGKIHVRLDLESGKRFIKLDDTISNTDVLKSISLYNETMVDDKNLSILNNTDKKYPNTNEIKKEKYKNVDKIKKEKYKNVDKIKKEKYRNIDEIKKELEEISLFSESEQSYMSKILNNIQNISINYESRLNELDKIKELLHDYNTALRFIELGGIESLLNILMLNINLTCERIMNALFAVLQNNFKAQIEFKNKNGLEYIMKILNKENLEMNCIRRITSVFSGSIRGCSECFIDMVEKYSNIFKVLVEYKKHIINTKLHRLLIEIYHSSKNEDVNITTYINKLITNVSLCSHYEFIKFNSDDNKSELANEMYHLINNYCNYEL